MFHLNFGLPCISSSLSDYSICKYRLVENHKATV